jgi:hypothetical protein
LRLISSMLVVRRESRATSYLQFFKENEP